MKKIYLILTYCFVISLFVACDILDQKGLADGKGDNAQNGIYMENANASGSIDILTSDKGGANFAIVPRIASAVNEDVTITIGVSEEALAQYNQKNKLAIRPIKGEDVEFTTADGRKEKGKISLTIKAGEIYSIVKGSIVSLEPDKYPYDGRYAIPVKIIEASGPMKVLSEPISTIVKLNRRIKTSVFHLKSGVKTHANFSPKTPYDKEMTEWTVQFTTILNTIHGQNQTTAYMTGGHGFYTRISKTGFQIKYGPFDGPETWANAENREGDWLYVSYVYRRKGVEANILLYINGKLMKTFTTDPKYITKDGGWNFGNEAVDNYYLREFRFWNRALTPAEIQDKSYLPEDPTAEGLEAYFPMTKESYDPKTKKFKDLTGKWVWSLAKSDESNYEIIENVVFPEPRLKIAN